MKRHKCMSSWPNCVSVEKREIETFSDIYHERWMIIIRRDMGKLTISETGVVIQYCPFCGEKLDK